MTFEEGRKMQETYSAALTSLCSEVIQAQREGNPEYGALVIRFEKLEKEALKATEEVQYNQLPRVIAALKANMCI